MTSNPNTGCHIYLGAEKGYGVNAGDMTAVAPWDVSMTTVPATFSLDPTISSGPSVLGRGRQSRLLRGQQIILNHLTTLNSYYCGLHCVSVTKY